MELEGKAAIVTGAGTGVGAATANALARRGCAVLVNYSRSVDAAERVAAEVEAAGVKSLAFKCDVVDDAACRDMVATAHQAFGRLDVLVNNAGVTTFIPHAKLEDVTPDAWHSILDVNLMGPFQCARAAKSVMEESGGGDIVNVSSIAGIAGQGSSIPYCASKAALNNLTVTLARVMAPKIRVNAVAPGFIDGSWLQEGLGDAFAMVKKIYQERAALGEVCKPEDVAAGILALIEGPDLVTGHVLPVEGGLLIGAS